MPENVEYPIQLVRVRNRQLVEARLCTASESHINNTLQSWQPVLQSTAEEDRDWDWQMKKRIYGRRPGAEAYAIECEQRTQGLMLLETLGHRSWYEPQQRIVYLRYVATAPWNRPSIQAPPKYRFVGTTLLEFARYRSHEVGYGGKVGLHALPGAEDFYRRIGMIDCGSDPNAYQLVYFEWYQRQASTNNERDLEIDWLENGDIG